ncbi:hypothetical protein E1B28_012100 [Marasmius oreades]|uniref:Association with the SNF1 complex (ASC) domain-containing protein n=1 Tax=Marasmius oreades TaxID=181124 RepID=A0A9P7UQF3_9AGAR|nr:uncharacterized protein E1B28_012100 [Marasmius oreades]KAG7088069.1 hypothetical protein E1B28_012100 [Marasmius oreades]
MYDCASPSGGSPAPPGQALSALLHYEAGWTSEIPLELLEVASEEEAFLSRAEGEAETEGSSPDPSVPIPDAPFPPELCRFLDRPILNLMLVRKNGDKGFKSSASPRDKIGLNMGHGSVDYTCSSTAGAASGVSAPTLHEGLGDKPSLPVPSHAVLGHLCTSAIKNGVVGLASTSRYKGKFMTTVYYRPLT